MRGPCRPWEQSYERGLSRREAEDSGGVTNSSLSVWDCPSFCAESSASQKSLQSWANWDIGHPSRGDTVTSPALGGKSPWCGGAWTGLPQSVRVGQEAIRKHSALLKPPSVFLNHLALKITLDISQLCLFKDRKTLPITLNLSCFKFW